MADMMRNLTNPVASANGVAAHARAYATCADLVSETTATWTHIPVTGFGKKRQRPKETLL